MVRHRRARGRQALRLAAAPGYGRGFGLGGELGMRRDIGIDVAGQYLGAIDEEMVGARDLAEIDLDVALVRQFVDQLLHRLRWDQRILVALQDQPGGRTRREEGEIVL